MGLPSFTSPPIQRHVTSTFLANRLVLQSIVKTIRIYFLSFLSVMQFFFLMDFQRHQRDEISSDPRGTKYQITFHLQSSIFDSH